MQTLERFILKTKENQIQCRPRGKHAAKAKVLRKRHGVDKRGKTCDKQDIKKRYPRCLFS